MSIAENQAARVKPRKLKRATVKEEFVALTGDAIDALILNQFIRYQAQARHVEQYIEEERARFAAIGQDIALPPTQGWFYKKAEEASEETMLRLSKSNMRARIARLIEAGWIEERANPHIQWDKTKQYRVNLIAIAAALRLIGYTLDGWLFESVAAESAPEVSKQNFEGDETELRSFETEPQSSKTELRGSKTEQQYQARQQEKTTRNNNNNVAAVVSPDGSLNGVTDLQPIAQKLTALGMPQADAARFAATDPARVSGWADYAAAQSTLKNPIGYIRKQVTSGAEPPAPARPSQSTFDVAAFDLKVMELSRKLYEKLPPKKRALIDEELAAGADLVDLMDRENSVRASVRLKMTRVGAQRDAP